VSQSDWFGLRTKMCVILTGARPAHAPLFRPHQRSFRGLRPGYPLPVRRALPAHSQGVSGGSVDDTCRADPRNRRAVRFAPVTPLASGTPPAIARPLMPPYGLVVFRVLVAPFTGASDLSALSPRLHYLLRPPASGTPAPRHPLHAPSGAPRWSASPWSARHPTGTRGPRGGSKTPELAGLLPCGTPARE
jgi:hypothetical protein